MDSNIKQYHDNLSESDRLICDRLYEIISDNLPGADAKVWHAHPVWFIDGNPIVGYSKLKHNVRLMFWSGQSFDEPVLLSTGSFKAAELVYTEHTQIKPDELHRYLKKAAKIQWDYKNIIKHKGLLRMKK